MFRTNVKNLYTHTHMSTTAVRLAPPAIRIAYVSNQILFEFVFYFYFFITFEIQIHSSASFLFFFYLPGLLSLRYEAGVRFGSNNRLDLWTRRTAKKHIFFLYIFFLYIYDHRCPIYRFFLSTKTFSIS